MSNKTILYTHSFAISWGDMDALGHVNNSKYFDYLQEARTLALLDIIYQANDMSYTPETQGDKNFRHFNRQGPVLAKVSCSFIKPIIYPANVEIIVYVHSPKNTSFIMDYDVVVHDKLVAKGESIIVWVSYKTGRPMAIPKQLEAFFLSDF